MRKLIPLLIGVALAATVTHVAHAIGTTITPTYDSFGSLPAATFGGSGIPNTSVAISHFDTATIGLTASQRFDNPVVTDDGAGTFYGVTGNDAAHGKPLYGRWNFDFYVNPGNIGAGYTATLLYDFDPGVGTLTSTLGSVSFPVTGLAQDSWNLGMGFLGVSALGINPPAGSFDPSAPGEYSFALILKDALGNQVATSAINVEVAGVPDTASTAFLLCGSIAGIAFLRNRKGVIAL